MRAWLLPILLLMLAYPGLDASADEDAQALMKRLVALRRRVIECIDRIEALEKEIASLDLPEPVGPVEAAEAEASPEVPTDAGPADGPFAFRSSRETLTHHGGSRRTEGAVLDALKWLAAHQAPSGAWEAATFMNWCNNRSARDRRPDGAGRVEYDVGVTGLALCAFLGAGYTSQGKHPFQPILAKGLRYLRSVQDAEGCLGARSSQHYIYNHAIAAIAVVEAYGMTGDPRLHEAAQRALDFIALARNPYYAWRYGVKPGDNDTSVSGWMIQALQSAKLLNAYAVRNSERPPFRIDEGAFDGVKAWLDLLTDKDYGRTGYLQRGGAPARPQELLEQFPGDKSESMTGVGMLARIFIGENPRTSEIIKKGAKLCVALPPTWNPSDGSIDMYYWYYATQAIFHVGGTSWSYWNKALKNVLPRNQRTDTTYCLYKGSWDPIGPWGPDGGRVYSTALCALCLETYYRYERKER